MLQLLLLIVILFAAAVYFLLIHHAWLAHRSFRAQGVAGPTFIPILGDILELNRYTSKDQPNLYWWDRYKKYGRVYSGSMATNYRIIMNDPDYIAVVMRNRNLGKIDAARLLLKDLIGVENLLLTEGEVHAKHRRIIAPAFYHENLKKDTGMMIQIVGDQLDAWIEKMNAADGSNAGLTLDLHYDISRLVLKTLAIAAFGDVSIQPASQSLIYHAFCTTVAALQQRFLNTIVFIPILNRLPICHKPMIDASIKEIHQFARQTIAARVEGKTKSLFDGPDLLDYIMSVKDLQTGEGLTAEEVESEALTFILAGHETTSALLTFCIYELTQHPNILQECRDEVDQVCGNPLTIDDLRKLTTLEAVIKETLRFHPPVPFISRQCNEEIIIDPGNGKPPITVPPRIEIALHVSVIHKLPEYWGEDAHEFKPHRWLDDSKPLKHPYAFIPFASHSRSCIGQHFALNEAKSILCTFLRKLDFALEPGQRFVPEPFITMRPKYPITIRITERKV